MKCLLLTCSIIRNIANFGKFPLKQTFLRRKLRTYEIQPTRNILKYILSKVENRMIRSFFSKQQ